MDYPFYIFTKQIRDYLEALDPGIFISEIRLRLHRPLAVCCGARQRYVSKTGGLTASCREAYIVGSKDLSITLQKLSQYSLYAFQEELREGYITLPGGHRAGICGKVIYDGDSGRSIRDITSLNIRIAHQIRDFTEDFSPLLSEEGRFLNTLIISSPGLGKTTLLRELIRVISKNHNVGVVDERSEIGNYAGDRTGFDLGPRTDLLDHCRKSEGMLMLLRTMNPEVIAADEIGDPGEVEAIKYIRFCGCSLLLTVHGSNLRDLMRRPHIGVYLQEYPFDRYVELVGPDLSGRIFNIYDGSGTLLWQGKPGGGESHV